MLRSSAILTYAGVDATDARADPPQADAEGDGGGDVRIGQCDGLARIQPRAADEGREDGDQCRQAPQHSETGERVLAAAPAATFTSVAHGGNIHLD